MCRVVWESNSTSTERKRWSKIEMNTKSLSLASWTRTNVYVSLAYSLLVTLSAPVLLVAVLVELGFVVLDLASFRVVGEFSDAVEGL